MRFDELKELAERRQSCRSFSGEKISCEEIEKILSIARLAPSACNSQPWRVKVVTEDGMMKKVAAAVQDEGKNPYVSEAGAFLCLYPAGAVMKKHLVEKFDDRHFVEYDIGELCAYITLAAETLGIASIIIGWVNYEALDEAVGYDGEYSCDLVIALGKSADADIRRKIRKPMEEIVF